MLTTEIYIEPEYVFSGEWHVEILADAWLKMMSRLEVKYLLTNVLDANNSQ
jgi:hypothetical protein